MEEVNLGELKRVCITACFKKSFMVGYPLDAHRAVGWAYGALKEFLHRYGKHLGDIRKISVDNMDGSSVEISAIVDLSRITCEDPDGCDTDMLDRWRYLALPYDGWHWNYPEAECWDSVEMIGEPIVKTGAATGVMLFRKDE